MIKNQMMISKNKLIEVYKAFLDDPLRLFLAKDLFRGNTNKFRVKYLKTLVKLGLIEEVEAFYKTKGNRIRKRSGITGYKLIRRDK